MTFTAKYRGECAACYEDISPGEEVAYDIEDRLVHVQCPTPVPEQPVEVCPACFMALPVSGVCDCG